MPSTLSERWGTIRSYSFLAFLAMHVIFVPWTLVFCLWTADNWSCFNVVPRLMLFMLYAACWYIYWPVRLASGL